MTPPIPQWSNSPRSGALSPALIGLLADAGAASDAGRPLAYEPGKGFYDAFNARGRIHPTTTARAGERRGLVQVTGADDQRQLHITGLGLDALAKIRRKP